MSSDYSKGAVLFSTSVATGGQSAASAILGYVYAKNQPIVLHTMDAFINQIGNSTNGLANVKLETLNGSTTICSILLGQSGGVFTNSTAGASNQAETRIGTSYNRMVAGDVYRVVAYTSDASLGYALRIWGSPPCF